MTQLSYNKPASLSLPAVELTVHATQIAGAVEGPTPHEDEQTPFVPKQLSFDIGTPADTAGEAITPAAEQNQVANKDCWQIIVGLSCWHCCTHIVLLMTYQL